MTERAEMKTIVLFRIAKQKERLKKKNMRVAEIPVAKLFAYSSFEHNVI